MHILLGCNISTQDLALAEEYLLAFYAEVPELYPETMLTANLHTTIHLCHFVQLLGPLWSYSTFGFENMNGYIKRHRHGTRNFLPSLAQAISTTFSVYACRNELSPFDTEAVHFMSEKQDVIVNGVHGKIHCCHLLMSMMLYRLLDFIWSIMMSQHFHFIL